MEEIALLNAALLLIEKLAPIVERQLKSGEITDEAQAEVRANYTKFRARTDLFSGPEWQPETPAPETQPPV